MADPKSTSKRCPRCREVKSLDQFAPHRKGSHGVASYCRPCNRQYLRQWYLAHRPPLQAPRIADPEKARASQRRWAAEHKDICNARTRRSYAKYAAQRREHRRLTYAADLAASREKGRRDAKQWRAANPEKASAIDKRNAQRHPERVRVSGRKRASTRRARKQRAFVEVVDPLVVYERDRGVCGICARQITTGQKWHVDHVILIARGGAHSYANVQLAHALCNHSKGAKLPPGHILQKVG